MHQSEFILQQTEQEGLFPDHQNKKSQGEVLEQTRPGNFESHHQSTYHSSQNKLSITEKEILSHEVIQEIVEKSMFSMIKVVRKQFSIKLIKQTRMFVCSQNLFIMNSIILMKFLQGIKIILQRVLKKFKIFIVDSVRIKI